MAHIVHSPMNTQPSATPTPLSVNFTKFVKNHARFLPDSPHATTTSSDDQQQQQLQSPPPPPQRLHILLIDPSEAVAAAMVHLIQSCQNTIFDIRIAEAHHTFPSSIIYPIGEALRAAASQLVMTSNLTIFRNANNIKHAAADAHIIVLGADISDVTGAVGKKHSGYVAAVATAKEAASQGPPGCVCCVDGDADGVGSSSRSSGGGVAAKVVVLEESERGELLFERNPCRCEGVEPPRPRTHRWAAVCPRNGVVEWVPSLLVDAYIAEEGIASREYIVRRAVVGLSRPPPPP